MNKNLSNLAYFRRGIALASVVLTVIVAVGNVFGLFRSPWMALRVLLGGVRTGFENSPLDVLGDGRNPLVVLIAGLVAWLLLPRETSYQEAVVGWFASPDEKAVELRRQDPEFAVAMSALVPIVPLFLLGATGDMGKSDSDFDMQWWLVVGGVCALLPTAVPMVLDLFVNTVGRWKEARITMWTIAGIMVFSAAMMGLMFTGWATLSVLAGALVAASPRYILPPVLWTLRKIFPAREPLPGSPPVR
jgi:hypothetical protein